jgi:hypothetical protein
MVLPKLVEQSIPLTPMFVPELFFSNPLKLKAHKRMTQVPRPNEHLPAR